MTERDLKEDRAVCEAADQGPWWKVDPPWGDGTYVGSGPSADPHSHKFIVCQFDEFDQQFSPTFDGIDVDDIGEFCKVQENMAFIAAAREGWPAALARLKQIEELCDGAQRCEDAKELWLVIRDILKVAKGQQ